MKNWLKNFEILLIKSWNFMKNSSKFHQNLEIKIQNPFKQSKIRPPPEIKRSTQHIRQIFRLQTKVKTNETITSSMHISFATIK